MAVRSPPWTACLLYTFCTLINIVTLHACLQNGCPWPGVFDCSSCCLLCFVCATGHYNLPSLRPVGALILACSVLSSYTIPMDFTTSPLQARAQLISKMSLTAAACFLLWQTSHHNPPVFLYGSNIRVMRHSWRQ